MSKFNTIEVTFVIDVNKQSEVDRIMDELVAKSRECSETEVSWSGESDGTITLSGYGYLDFPDTFTGLLDDVVLAPAVARGEFDGEPYHVVIAPDPFSREQTEKAVSYAQDVLPGFVSVCPDGPVVPWLPGTGKLSPAYKVAAWLSPVADQVLSMTKSVLDNGTVLFTGCGTSRNMNGILVFFRMKVDEEGDVSMETDHAVSPLTGAVAVDNVDRFMKLVADFATADIRLGKAAKWYWPTKGQWQSMLFSRVAEKTSEHDLAAWYLSTGGR